MVLKNGEIIDKYNAFLNPGKPIPREIVELTSITDEMVADAPGQEEGLDLFLDWVGDRPLAAHNAEFDMGFIAEGCRRMGRPFRNSSLDTLILCQNLQMCIRDRLSSIEWYSKCVVTISVLGSSAGCWTGQKS